MRPQLLPASPIFIFIFICILHFAASSRYREHRPQVTRLDSTRSDSDSTQPAPPCLASRCLAPPLPCLVLPSTDVLALSHLVSARIRLGSSCFISNCFHLLHLTCYRLLSTCIGISIGLSRVIAHAAFPGKQADGRAATTTIAAFTPPSTRLISTPISHLLLSYLVSFHLISSWSIPYYLVPYLPLLSKDSIFSPGGGSVPLHSMDDAPSQLFSQPSSEGVKTCLSLFTVSSRKSQGAKEFHLLYQASYDTYIHISHLV
jgi:hypothetical protein